MKLFKTQLSWVKSKKIIALAGVLVAGIFLLSNLSGVIAATKIFDAGDVGEMGGAGKQVVRTSGGTLYAVLNNSGSCEVYKSTNGTSWAQQDTADNPACEVSAPQSPISVAIDSTDTLHIVYTDDTLSNLIKYIPFTTSTDQFGTEATAFDATVITTSFDIAVDSNDKPHLAVSDTLDVMTFNVKYTNRISGSWKAAVTLENVGITAPINVSIAISEDNIPEISYVNQTDADLTAAVGNVNDAASFTLRDVDTSVNAVSAEAGSSIAIDSSGNTWIGYVDENGATDFVTLVEHLDADAWTTWQTPVTNSNGGYEPSIAINGTVIYVFYQDSSDADVKYNRYTGSWLGETSLQTGTYQDAKAKWSFNFNNQGSTQIDYLFSDGLDVWWDKLIITKIDDAGDPGAMAGAGRQVVRTSAGTLYAVINDGGSCEVWKSSDGTSWSEVDSADNPACKTGTAVVVAIDTSGILHIAYIRTDTFDSVYYKQLNTSTDQFGSEETIMFDLGVAVDSIAIAVDSNSVPHVVYNQTDLAYDNRIGGAWNGTDVVLERIDSGQLDITISEDNIPEISYIDLTSLILRAALGNVNDAASFTLQSVDTTINSTSGIRGASIAVDSSGNTWIGYADATGTNQITLVKHNDADAWTTWQTPVTNSNVGNEPSIAINGTDVYIFYEDSADDDIKYDRYTGSWLGETTLQTGTYQDVHVKWSFNFNNQGSTQIDYLFSDGTDVFWDKLSLPPTKVVFTNAARTQLAGACGGSANVFTIQLQDATDTARNPTGTTVIQVTSNSPSYTIYSDDTCATLVSNGSFTFTTSENTKNFYLVDNIVSAPTWTFTAAKTSGPDSITSGTQTYTINEGAKSTKIRGGVKIQGGTKIQ